MLAFVALFSCRTNPQSTKTEASLPTTPSASEDLQARVHQVLHYQGYCNLLLEMGEESLSALYFHLENDASSGIRNKAASAIGCFGRNS
jgi:hypothetical protein